MRGQIVIVLLLIMLVILSIGLAVTQRSLTDITTSTQTEQSSRAFSAAEAGIEKAVQSPAPQPTSYNISLGNDSSAQVQSSGELPTANQALEYPPLSKEDIAQFWFVKPSDLSTFYNNGTFDVYFGNENLTDTSTDKPALEINVITLSASNYISTKYYYDSNASRALTQNNFLGLTCSGNNTVSSTSSTTSKFFCKVRVPPTGSYTGTPVMARIRLLYTTSKHKIAVAPTGGGSLPPQAKIFTSTGNAGNSQKRVQVFRLDNYIPHYFDFSVFSSGDIIKN